MKLVKSGVYSIVNMSNGKLYIGSAVNFKNRWRSHLSLLRRSIHDNGYLQNAWNKYGEDNFIFYIMQRCGKDDLITLEQSWLSWTKSFDRAIGYNIKPNAHSSFGYKHTPEALAKMAAKSLGTKQSAETIARKIASMSRPEKWPCAEGSRCKCDRCRKVKNEYALNWMNAKRLRMYNCEGEFV